MNYEWTISNEHIGLKFKFLIEVKSLNELILIENKNKIYHLFMLLINQKKQINNWLKQENSFDVC
jgi:hypothetical protein